MRARQILHQLSRDIVHPFEKFDVVLSPVVKARPWKLGVYETGFADASEYFARVYGYSPFCWPYNVSGQTALSLDFGYLFAAEPWVFHRLRTEDGVLSGRDNDLDRLAKAR